ncbi:MAG: hydrogenase nickel incorporation protein HypB [Thiobacillus sp.]|nr:hydrogenase nickel incorporation protein HypB [Thiobacillus sp.]
MCTVCGCGKGEVRIEGAVSEHGHVGADGTVYRHVHSHGYGLGGHVHGHRHEHAHEHGRAHSHPHEHRHGHDQDAAGHSRGELHGAGTAHEHGALHADDAPHSHGHDLHYGLGPAHAHAPGLSQERMVRIERDILGKNDALAAENRRWLAEHGVFAVNLVSSPGSGKTTLLVKTIEALRGELPVSVVEGDQQTSNDADRIRAAGAPAVQVNTGKGCHLDALMVGQALARLAPERGSLLLIENVGNLVCPAAFDLGEAHKVVILSVTEGEDKPLKYPDMFHAADLMLLSKVDLLPYLSFDVERCVEYARRINPRLTVLQVSSTSGAGMAAWLDWLRAGVGRAAG